MPESWFMKFSSESAQLSEGLICRFSQSTEDLILIFALNSFQGVLQVNPCSG